MSKDSQQSLRELYNSALAAEVPAQSRRFRWPEPTARELFEAALIGLGALLIVLSLASSWLDDSVFLSDQQVADFNQAASDFHGLTSLPYGQADGDELQAARDRFEAARDRVASSRNRRILTRRMLSIAGFGLVLVGGLISIARRTGE